MLKKSIYLLIVVASLAAIVFVFFRLKNLKGETTDPWNLLPSKTAVALEITSFENIDSELTWLQRFCGDSSSSVFPYAITGAHTLLNLFEEHRKSDEVWATVLSKTPVLFFTSATTINNTWTAIVPLEDIHVDEHFAHLKKSLGGQEKEARTFKGTEIYISGTSGYLALIQNCLVLASSSSALEEVVLIAESGQEADFNRMQTRMVETMATDVPIHLFFRDKENWFQTDIITVEGTKRLAGYIHVQDTSHSAIVLLSEGKNSSICDYVPSSATTLETRTYENFEEGWKLLEEFYTDGRTELFWGQAWKDLGDSCQCDLNESALSWRGNEWGNFLFNQSDTSFTISFIKIESGEDAMGMMRPLMGSDSINYMGTTIAKLNFPQVFERNSSFNFMNTADYVGRIGDFVFFASDSDAIKSLVKANLEKNTMSNQLSKEWGSLLSDNCGQFIYQNEYSISLLPENFVNCFGNASPLVAGITKLKPFLYAINVVTESGTSSANEIPEVADADGYLWKKELGAEISCGPWLMKNHNTQETELLVQDIQNTIYLIDSKGKLLWTKTLNGQVVGDVVQIDALKNGKLQMVLTTKQELLILDRNGEPLPGFPLRYNAELTSELAIFDYDRSRNYRLIGGLADGTVFNYTQEGKTATGWIYQKTQSAMKAVSHLKIGSEDWLVTVMVDDQIQCLKRNGQLKYQPKAKAISMKGKLIMCAAGKSIEESFISYLMSSGSIIRKKLNATEAINEVKLTAGEFFALVNDVNSDQKQDWVISYGNEVKAFNNSLQPIFDAALPDVADGKMSVGKGGVISIPGNDGKGYSISANGSVSQILGEAVAGIVVVDLNRDGKSETVATKGRQIMVKEKD